MITFSVVTITYNAAAVLRPTLDSVLMQNYPHVEHLIIDGASTDETISIAKAYQKQSDDAENGHIVKIQSEPDKGLYDAMNKGLQLATGDYIVFMNAGDRFPDAETLNKVMLAAVVGDGEEHPAVLFGNTDIIDDKGNFLYHRRLSPPRTAHVAFFPSGHGGMPSSLFMHVWILLALFLMTYLTVIQQMLTGV